MINVANTLTLLRIAVIPLVIAGFYMESLMGDCLSLTIFISACITDFLDGYIARAWHQTSLLGRFLDPIADKLLVASTLLMLVAFQRITGFSVIAAIIILCREILVSGLREFLSTLKAGIPVIWLAKFKTFSQMTALSLLIISENHFLGTLFHNFGVLSLWIAALLTLVTGGIYLKATSIYFKA